MEQFTPIKLRLKYRTPKSGSNGSYHARTGASGTGHKGEGRCNPKNLSGISIKFVKKAKMWCKTKWWLNSERKLSFEREWSLLKPI